MKKRTLFAALLAATTVAAWGERPAAVAPPAPEVETAALWLRYDRAPLATVAHDLSERAGRPVLLDSTVRARSPVTLSVEARDLEEALGHVTGIVGAAWRKVYLPAPPAGEGKERGWTGDQVRAAVLAVEALEGSGVILEERGRATLFLRSVPAAAGFEGKVRATWPNMRPYYLITDPRAAASPETPRREAVAREPGEATPEAFAAMERERMALFLRLSPEQRAAAVSQALDFMLQADPAAMQEMLQAGMQAWMQSMQRMPPEQRQQLIQRQLQLMQSIPPQVWQDIFSLFRPQ